MTQEIEDLLFRMLEAGWNYHLAGPMDEGAIKDAHVPALQLLHKLEGEEGEDA